MPAGAHIIPADHLPRWSRYAAMMRDCGHNGAGRGDGVLSRHELTDYIDTLYGERDKLVAAHSPTRTVDIRLRDSEAMLRDMVEAGAEGLSYLPEEVLQLNLRPEINARIVEILMKDDDAKAGRITQGVLDRARGRYMNIEARSMVELNSRQRALDEMKEIAEAVGLL